jgi:imidazolonepropionase-like amidohydrolase
VDKQSAQHLSFLRARSSLVVISILLAACQASPEDSFFALVNVNVVDVERGQILVDHAIVVRGEEIVSVGAMSDTSIPDSAQVVDGSMRFVIPGLWDMHVHLIDPDTPGDLDVVLPLLTANGVVGVRDTGSSDLDAILALREQIRERERSGPRIVLSGKILDGIPVVFPPDAIAVATPETARETVDELASADVDTIKLYEMLQPDVFAAAVQAANRRGLPIAAHVPLTMLAGDVSDLGIDSFEHLRNIELACSSEADALLAERISLLRDAIDAIDDSDDVRAFDYSAGYGAGALVRKGIHESQRPIALETIDPERCATLLRRLAINETWQVPTLFMNQHQSGFVRADQIESVRATLRYVPEQIVSDWENQAEGLASASIEQQQLGAAQGRWYADLVRQMHDSGVGLLAGTDVSVTWMVPGFSLHEELQALVRAGLTPLESLQTATVNPARFLGEDDSFGRIEVGYVADLVILGANPIEDIANTERIEGVILRGEYLDRAELNKLLESAQVAAN